LPLPRSSIVLHLSHLPSTARRKREGMIKPVVRASPPAKLGEKSAVSGGRWAVQSIDCIPCLPSLPSSQPANGGVSLAPLPRTVYCAILPLNSQRTPDPGNPVPPLCRCPAILRLNSTASSSTSPRNPFLQLSAAGTPPLTQAVFSGSGTWRFVGGDVAEPYSLCLVC
jgi:hypothetical protein